MRDTLSLSQLRFLDHNLRVKLNRFGVHSLWQLVEHGLTARERRLLARRLGVEEGNVLKLVRLADMCRLCDIELAELLIEAGVNTPLELPYRSLSELCAMVSDAAQRFGFSPPARSELEELRKKARTLPPLFDY
ncbi:MAG: DUF4332 domain-containing protein [Thermosphaera sp.]